MASRENQGLHIALILLVMLTVGLCVVAFVFYSKAETQRGEAEDAKNRMATAESAEKKANFQSQKLIEMISGGGKTMTQVTENLANIPGDEDPTIKQIETEFRNNMMLFGPAEQETESARNYQSLPDFLLSRIRDLNQQLTDLRRNEGQLSQEKQDLQNELALTVKNAQAEMKKNRDDLETERAKFTADLADLRKQMEDQAMKLTEKDTRIVELNTQLEDERADFNDRIEKLAKTVDDQRNKLRNLQQTTFEVPDAIVTTVNQKESVLYIDVGSADNLKVQQTFSVFDKGTTGIMNAQPKGRVEVIQILGAHVSLCRILDDKVTNIIVPDDLLFTPVWSPGERIHIALAGFIDITDSGQDDTALLTRLIELNGGVVDDAVSVQTRYLVQGEDRGASPDGEAPAGAGGEFDKKMAAAIEIGVDRVSPEKLLTMMGWRADVTTITLGTGKAADVQGATTEAPGEESPFRKRAPPRGGDGAFE